MNNVVDEVLAGSPRYTIKDNGGTTLYDNVQIDLKTQVTTPGTPLNRALFESIRTDLNSRLLVSNKATQAEAQAGANDTKYMTPLKNQNKLDYMAGSNTSYSGTGTGSSSQTVTSTIFNSSNYNTTKGVITIWCNINLQTPSGTSNATFLTINGTNFSGIDRVTRAITSYSDTEPYIDTETISGSSLTYTRSTRLGSSLPYTPCKIEINYTNKMCEITLIKQYHFSSGSSSRSGYEDHKVFFSFDTLTTIQLSLNSQYSTAKVNIATSR